MNLKTKHICFITFLLGIFLLARCTDMIAGAGTETTNGIVGSVVDEKGVPLENVVVKLLQSDYNPVNLKNDTIITATTDANGKFSFSKLDTGHYHVIARHQNSMLCGTLSDVNVNEKSSIVELDKFHLLKPATIHIDFSESLLKSGYCYFPGTDIISQMDSLKMVILENIPSGKYDSLMLVSDSTRNALYRNVSVAPNQVISIVNPEWAFSKKLLINTTTVSSALYDVPLLLRLDDLGENFFQATRGGVDFSVVSMKNAKIPHEIEFWNDSQNSAAIWIRIDTLNASNESQYVTILWGNNANLKSKSSSKNSVFDTTSGFMGVWHLSDIPGEEIVDATQNHYNGISPDTSRVVSGKGVIGNCFEFDGERSYITMPGTASGKINFGQNDHFTISTWVYINELDDLSHVIVSKGNTQYFLWYTPIHLSSTLFEFANFRDQSGWDLSVSKATCGKWVHLVGVRDSLSQKLYIDGECVDTLIDFTAEFSRYDQSDLIVGRFSQNMGLPNGNDGLCFFKGKIDEIQISNVARTAEWIKFTYLNQCENSKSITFK